MSIKICKIVNKAKKVKIVIYKKDLNQQRNQKNGKILEKEEKMK